jgi:hypothetical protein
VISWVWSDVRSRTSSDQANMEAQRLEDLLAARLTQKRPLALPEL